MICILALSKVSRFYLVSVIEQAGLNLTWSKIPEDTFSHDVAHVEISTLNSQVWQKRQIAVLHGKNVLNVILQNKWIQEAGLI